MAEKKDISTLKSWQFEASENIITKFKSQGLYTIKIKYWNASRSGFPPSLIPALQNKGILHHKTAKLPKHLQQSVSNIISAGDDVLQPEVLQMLAEIHKGVYAIEAQPNNKTWQDGICKT